MQQLTWVSGSFSAHVLNARLRSEGIDAELRGPVDGPYALTVGDLARVDVYVPADQMDDAQLVVLAAEVDATLAAPSEWSGEKRTRSPWARGAAVAALLAAAMARTALYARRGGRPCRSAGEQAPELVALDAPEGASRRAPLQDGDLELFG